MSNIRTPRAPRARHRAIVGAAMLALVGALLPGGSAAGAAPCAWTSRMLPGLPGSTGGAVLGTDGGDRFVGYVMKDGWRKAVLWQAGQAHDLSAAFPEGSEVNDVNRHGYAVGEYFQDGFPGAVLWHGDQAVGLAEPPGGFVFTTALAINDAGLIVGQAADHDGLVRGLVWSVHSPGVVRDLGAGDGDLLVNDVSDRGIMVGTTFTDTPNPGGRAVAITRTGAMRALPGTVVGMRTHADAIAGQFLEQVVGSETDPATGTTRPVIWRYGVPRALPGIGAAAAVNSQGLVAGTLVVGGVIATAAVWRDGVLTRLPGPIGGGGLRANTVTADGRIGGQSGTGPIVWSCA
jgi:uncharacterized membrane protein